MAQPWCGAVLASEAVGRIEGTLPVALLGNDGERAPDLSLSLAWNLEPNEAGYAGTAYATGGAAGLGQHGSMSRTEMRNILFARGPRFASGLVVDSPSGSADVAPTVLRLLGLDPGVPMDGRALTESLAGGAPVSWSTETHEAERAVHGGIYRQRVVLSRVGHSVYADEGNGRLDS